MRNALLALTVLAILFAGCMGGGPAADDGNATDGNGTDGAMDGNETDGATDGGGTDDGTADETEADSDAAYFELLISDQRGAIGDFASLHVTLSEARVFSGNGSNASFETMDLENATVDLTTVVGANATSIANVSLAPGNYTKIELHVASTEGVVNNSTVDVKVPSQKLQITKPFTVRANATTSFVFDINVVKKGGDQGYNLLPVISESGVAGEDVEVHRTGGERGGHGDGHHDGGHHDDGAMGGNTSTSGEANASA